jgi:hypothetical protein
MHQCTKTVQYFRILYGRETSKAKKTADERREQNGLPGLVSVRVKWNFNHDKKIEFFNIALQQAME